MPHLSFSSLFYPAFHVPTEPNDPGKKKDSRKKGREKGKKKRRKRATSNSFSPSNNGVKRISNRRKEKRRTPKEMSEKDRQGRMDIKHFRRREERKNNQIAPGERVIIHIDDCRKGGKGGKLRMSLLRGSRRIWRGSLDP